VASVVINASRIHNRNDLRPERGCLFGETADSRVRREGENSESIRQMFHNT
jgi:hypothetical protein